MNTYGYHATFLGRINSIARSGLQTSGGGQFSGYGGHSRGRIFLTAWDGIRYWLSKMEDLANSQTDWNDPDSDAGWMPVALRINIDSLNLAEDELGTRDSGGEDAWYVENNIPSNSIEIWTGSRWTPIRNADTDAMADDARKNATYTSDGDEPYDEWGDNDGWWEFDLEQFEPSKRASTQDLNTLTRSLGLQLHKVSGSRGAELTLLRDGSTFGHFLAGAVNPAIVEPECSHHPLWTIKRSGLDNNLRGQGLGAAAYQWILQEARKQGAALGPNTCTGESTSQDAKRVWDSLRRHNPTRGPLVLASSVRVEAPPYIAAPNRVARRWVLATEDIHARLLPAGSTLYRGTDGGPVRVSGWDTLAWFTDRPSIAQLYIPSSGGSEFRTIEALTSPTRKDKTLQAVQKMLGIEYNLSGMKWETHTNSLGYKYDRPKPGGRIITCWVCHRTGYVAEGNDPRNPSGNPPPRRDPRLAYRMSNLDKHVIQAFLDRKTNHQGKVLDTDGTRLDRMGMGGGEFAHWELPQFPHATGAVLVTRPMAVRSDQTLLNFLRKTAKTQKVTLLYGRKAKACPQCFGTGDDWSTHAYFPKGWDHAPTEDEVAGLMEREGFREMGSDVWEIKMTAGKVMHPKAKIPGAVYIATTKRPMIIAKREDGSDYDANDFSLFKRAAKLGYDGVFIWDLAQSDTGSNINHASIGLFGHTLGEIQLQRIPATYQEYTGDPGTPEVPSPKGTNIDGLSRTSPPRTTPK